MLGGVAFGTLFAAPVMSVVTVCSVGGGVCVFSVVGTDIFVCIGVIVDVRVVVSVVLSLNFLLEKFVKQYALPT